MYIFNPEHDMCLANNDPNYVPPQAAADYVAQHAEVLQWMQGLDPESEKDPDAIVPWGWNRVLRQQLLKQGISPDKLPTDRQLDWIRDLSHRKTAAGALAYIREQMPAVSWPQVPVFATSLEEEEHTLTLPAYRNGWVLKAPWSGSGRGLRWGCGEPLPTDRGWCKNHIASQGSVEVSVRRSVVQDLAMLWKCDRQVTFVGYSLFYTKNGVYLENALWPDAQIENHLQFYVPLETLLTVRQVLQKYLDETFAGKYKGFIGVDQFVYREAGRYLLHPAVEINVRMTMGLLAHHRIAGPPG